MRKTWLVMMAAAMLAGCGSGPAASGNATLPAEAARPTDWAKFRDGFVATWFKLDPANAVYQGKHEFDGQLPDWSAAGLKRQSDFLRDSIAEAKRFDPAKLSEADRFERQYLMKVAEGKLFWLDDADQPHRNPAYYVTGGLDPNVYIARPYADKATRMRAMIGFFDQIPNAAKNIRANLKVPMPASFVNYGVNAFRGFADFYAGDARKAFADVSDAALQARFAASSAKAAAAMKSIADWLESERSRATTDFALGAERFQRMLWATEMVDMPLALLERLGESDLKANQEALAEACTLFAPGQSIPACIAQMNANKPVGGPVAEARRQIPLLRAFVDKAGLITIPGTEAALVEESPPYNRQNSAYIDPPGPFDKGIPSVYYISPPDPSWPKAVQDGFVPGKQDLLFTSVHEVMPGHFVQFLHANRSPSIFGRLFVGYAYAEGWAHYAEQMMWDAGLNKGDPETHIGQLANALLRNCRFLAAIKLHAGGEGQQSIESMFRNQCYQDEGTAKQQAARGTYDPAYLNYTLGKLMILTLRRDWEAKHGGKSDPKGFHDAFLSYGGPPVPLVRQAMMKEARPSAFGVDPK
ncbi:MAG: DUF885 domain-containing protein [Sphingomonas sp.]|nr:DUF885 domain-containing protein [Sphingomonas sp.]